MPLRSGITNFFNNARQWGLRTGTNLVNYYNQARNVADQAHPLLLKTNRLIEEVSEGIQSNPHIGEKSKRHLGTLNERMRKLTEGYGTALSKANTVHDLIAAQGRQAGFFA